MIALAPAADTPFHLRIYFWYGTVQGFRVKELAPTSVGRALVELAMSIADVLEMVDLPRFEEHCYSKRMNCGVSPLDNVTMCVVW